MMMKSVSNDILYKRLDSDSNKLLDCKFILKVLVYILCVVGILLGIYYLHVDNNIKLALFVVYIIIITSCCCVHYRVKNVTQSYYDRNLDAYIYV
jgi:membrane protein YdbS with pleckstrin-like domain